MNWLWCFCAALFKKGLSDTHSWLIHAELMPRWSSFSTHMFSTTYITVCLGTKAALTCTRQPDFHRPTCVRKGRWRHKCIGLGIYFCIQAALKWGCAVKTKSKLCRGLSLDFSALSKLFSILRIEMRSVKGSLGFCFGVRVNTHPGLFQVTCLWSSSNAMAAWVWNKLTSGVFPSVNYLGRKWSLQQSRVLTLMTNIGTLDTRTGQSGFGALVHCPSTLVL